MKLRRIILEHFRNYEKKIFTPSPETTVVIGSNASGKTNFLEAIMLISTGDSFRAGHDDEMIMWGKDVAKVSGHVEGAEVDLDVQLTHGVLAGHRVPKKRLLVNGVPRRSVDFVGKCPAVLFWPQDLELITDSPSVRRRYLDQVLTQVDREYRRTLLSYERGLRQRNRLLDQVKEGIARPSQLLFWNQLLITAGGYITDARAAFIAFMNEFSVSSTRYQIIYDKSVISQLRLEQYKEQEIAAKATLVGPHRDDFFVQSSELNPDAAREVERDLSRYGSRGQQRLGVLWLKLGELLYIEAKTGERPMLLLDDIFSELDSDHRALVLAMTKKQQTIITSAELDILRHVSGEVATIAV